VGQRTEEVTVEGVSPIVEFSDKLNSYVDQDRINEMPLNGRSFSDLAYMVPTVEPSAQGGDGSGFNIGGAAAKSST
jgi:hypothetical protein